MFGRGDLVPGARWDQDGVAWADWANDAIDFHGSSAFEDEIEFLAELVVVSLGGLAYGDGGFGEGLVLDWCISSIQDATDRAAIFGGKWRLLGKLVDRHGCACHRRTLSPERQAHSLPP